MKILIALPYFPYPPTGGGHQATFHMINYLRNFMEITLVCPYAEQSDWVALRKKWPEVNIEIPAHTNFNNKKRLFMGKARHLFANSKQLVKNLIAEQKNGQSQNPLEVCNKIRHSNMRLYRNNFVYNNNQFINRFQELVTVQNFDIIQVEFAELIGLVHCMPEKSKKIFVHHEVSFIVMERELKTLDHIAAYDKYLFNQEKMMELTLLNKYDKILVLSNQDKDVLSNYDFLHEKLAVSPFAVPVHSEVKKDFQFSFKNKIVFLGTENHNPNLDAVYWFVKEVLPLILQEMPQITFYVIGSWKKEVVKLFAGSPHIIFTGFVENLENLLNGSVMIVPVRIGSGVRTKIIDAVKWRVPVLTTTIGVEGIPLEDGIECLIADSPEMFVKKLKLYHDNVYATTLINNAFHKISQINDIKQYGELRKHIYESMLSPEYSLT